MELKIYIIYKLNKEHYFKEGLSLSLSIYIYIYHVCDMSVIGRFGWRCEHGIALRK
jgi:hypothetical protein